jgi:hypothetical protein
MEENIETGFDEFFGAFDEGEGNHTEPETAAEETEPTTGDSAEQTGEAAEEAESEENSEGANTNESEEKSAEAKAEAEKPEEKRSFDNIKVNGEIRSVSYEDAPAWIQKGMDYDRVKGKLAEAQQTAQDLQGRMDKYQESIDILEMIAEDTKMDMGELLHSLHKSFRMQQGESEKEAEANIRAAKAERKASAVASQKEKEQTAANDQKARANREFAEFKAAHPDVNLDDALAEKLKPDVLAGMSLLGAYQKMQNKEQADRIAELERQLAAKKQNEKNRVSSPGSQKDSGGQRKRDTFDDFFDAFDK